MVLWVKCWNVSEMCFLSESLSENILDFPSSLCSTWQQGKLDQASNCTFAGTNKLQGSLPEWISKGCARITHRIRQSLWATVERIRYHRLSWENGPLQPHHIEDDVMICHSCSLLFSPELNIYELSLCTLRMRPIGHHDRSKLSEEAQSSVLNNMNLWFVHLHHNYYIKLQIPKYYISNGALDCLATQAWLIWFQRVHTSVSEGCGKGTSPPMTLVLQFTIAGFTCPPWRSVVLKTPNMFGASGIGFPWFLLALDMPCFVK